MLLKYFVFTTLIYCLFLSPPVASNVMRPSSGLELSLHNCNKDKLFQFPDFSAITDLNIHHCYIPTLENAFFIRFTALSNLEITDSQLSYLEDYAFHGLKHLRSLSLAHNNLTQVKSWSNEQMSSLISLDLKHNAIRELTLKSFSRYPNLQRLNLLGNLLEDIDDGIFRWMPHLKYLNLGRNRLIAVENRNFHGMHRLSYLALHFNAIEDVESDAFGTNYHLRTLRLEGNKLTDLNFLKVKSLTRLQHLNLSFNELQSLDDMTFSKDFEIVNLDLSHNRLMEIKEDVFLGLESLEVRKRFISREIYNFLKISFQKLNISHNSLSHIAPRSFDELTSLEYLELNHNELQHLHPDIFNVTSLLQHINLSHNKLTNIETELFSSLAYLKSLDLSQNQLSNDEFIENLALELQCHELRLNLSDNHYRIVNISSLASFEQVELAGNWWSCKWLIKEMLKIPKSINFGRSYAVHTEWSLDILETKGINCYDENTRRSIIILDTSRIWEQRFEEMKCAVGFTENYKFISLNTGSFLQPPSSLEVQPSPPPLNWPRIKLDRFDSRSVVIWMLIAIAIAFSALRIGRKLVDQKERKRKLRELREKVIL